MIFPFVALHLSCSLLDKGALRSLYSPFPLSFSSKGVNHFALGDKQKQLVLVIFIHFPFFSLSIIKAQNKCLFFFFGSLPKRKKPACVIQTGF